MFSFLGHMVTTYFWNKSLLIYDLENFYPFLWIIFSLFWWSPKVLILMRPTGQESHYLLGLLVRTIPTFYFLILKVLLWIELQWTCGCPGLEFEATLLWFYGPYPWPPSHTASEVYSARCMHINHFLPGHIIEASPLEHATWSSGLSLYL